MIGVLERLCAAAEELQRTHPPDVALAEWMDRFVTYIAAKRGMADALQSIVASDSSLFANARTQLSETLTALLEAASADCAIRRYGSRSTDTAGGPRAGHEPPNHKTRPSGRVASTSTT